MLPPERRLRRSADFAAVRRAGKRWRGRWLSVSAAPNGLDHPRYGFVVSSRVGNAVTRNRVKRRLGEAIRAGEAPAAAGHDVVVIAHRTAAQAAYRELAADLDGLLARAGLR
jgi:ribonuclease P protein component